MEKIGLSVRTEKAVGLPIINNTAWLSGQRCGSHGAIISRNKVDQLLWHFAYVCCVPSDIWANLECDGKSILQCVSHSIINRPTYRQPTSRTVMMSKTRLDKRSISSVILFQKYSHFSRKSSILFVYCACSPLHQKQFWSKTVEKPQNWHKSRVIDGFAVRENVY